MTTFPVIELVFVLGLVGIGVWKYISSREKQDSKKTISQIDKKGEVAVKPPKKTWPIGRVIGGVVGVVLCLVVIYSIWGWMNKPSPQTQVAPLKVATVMDAPLPPAWSQKYDALGNYSIEVSGCVLIQPNERLPVPFCPGEEISLGRTHYIKFQSETKEVEKVTISR